MKKKTAYIALLLILFVIAYQTFVGLTEKKRTHTIGFISLTKVDQQTFQGFTEAMKEYGYIENSNIIYLNDGPAEKIENLHVMVDNQIKKGVDLFFVSSTPATLAVQNATLNRSIPVVFCPVNDPVASGVVASLEYPGGNITGIKLPSGEQERFKWFLRIVPSAKRVLIPYTPGDKSSEFSRLESFYAAEASAVEIIEVPVLNETMLATLLEKNQKNVDALFLPRDSSIESYTPQFVAFANENRLPLSVPSLQQVEQGALFTYGFIHTDMGRQAARLADAILKGTEPSSLPVETAKNHLVINLDAARKIGLTIPESILAKADRLIGNPQEK